ncbi:MAG: nucleotide exchange factor GrpE [Gemmatimonadetes bacterium]|nr:nucleotide exchange factor GrpE [Gemmatimonadota bacterium]MDA1104086.1 nucleotide exchange factor GrpE [Gemmatimonadota bacterium]
MTNNDASELEPEVVEVDAPASDEADAPEAEQEIDDDAPDAESEGVGGSTQDEFEALNDRHLRLVAEFNNYRRRTEQERLSAWARAQADLVEKFVDLLDDLHRVAELDLTNATVEAIMEGIDLVERKFVRALGDSNVEMIDPAGQMFDPTGMEAMMRVPAESDDQVDHVAQVFQKGYSLKGTLIRPARVSVYTKG